MAKRTSKKRAKIFQHKTLKRSYREDYKRELEVPGIMYHIFATFRVIFKNWKLFLPLLVLSAVMAVVLVGLMSESMYQQFQIVLDQTAESLGDGELGNVGKAGLLLISTVTTGGLSGGSSESAGVFAVLIFLMIWLVTIFILRHRLAEHNVTLRGALYNAMTPLMSTLVVLLIVIVQCIPIIILVIVYSAAVQTEFLATPFYALVFFIFACLMVLLSGYLLSSSLMALVAVSAPGMYPLEALRTASELMMGRRTRLVIRVFSLILTLLITWTLVMVPLISFDLVMQNFEWTLSVPFIPICLLSMTCFTGIYITAYFYLYYRWMLQG